MNGAVMHHTNMSVVTRATVSGVPLASLGSCERHTATHSHISTTRHAPTMPSRLRPHESHTPTVVAGARSHMWSRPAGQRQKERTVTNRAEGCTHGRGPLWRLKGGGLR